MHLRDKPPATARSEDAAIAAQGKAPLQMQNYSERVIDNELDELISGAPAIALDGAKGVGKTVTAARRAMTTLALDDLEQRELVAADIGAALRKERQSSSMSGNACLTSGMQFAARSTRAHRPEVFCSPDPLESLVPEHTAGPVASCESGCIHCRLPNAELRRRQSVLEPC